MNHNHTGHTAGPGCPACKEQREEAHALTHRLFKLLTAEKIPRNHATCAALLACAANCLGDGDGSGTRDKEEMAWFLRQAMTFATGGTSEITTTVIKLDEPTAEDN